jgi:signal transduction histidine kinase
VNVAAAALAIGGVLRFAFPRTGGAGVDLFTLITDTIFLLLFSAFGAGNDAFLSAALYFHVLLSTMFLHPWWDTWMVVAVCSIVLGVLRTPRTIAVWPVFIWMGLLAVVGAIYRSKREAAFEEFVRHANEYREQADRVREAERQQLAGDFHDGPLQVFTGIQLRLEVLRKILRRSPQEADAELCAIQNLAKSETAEMRAFLRGIRPVELGRAGLVASLRRVVDEFHKHSGVSATFQHQGLPGAESAAAATELVQILREALNNVQKHSRASRVAVTVRISREQIEISIEDNGVGFAFGGVYNLEELETLRMGPASIQTRVRAIGGKLMLESRPERGSALTVQVAT